MCGVQVEQVWGMRVKVPLGMTELVGMFPVCFRVEIWKSRHYSIIKLLINLVIRFNDIHLYIKRFVGAL